eukprot:g136.t1
MAEAGAEAGAGMRKASLQKRAADAASEAASEAASAVAGAAGGVAHSVLGSAHEVLDAFVGPDQGDTGFVTFRRRVDAAVAAQVAYAAGGRTGRMGAEPAPLPDNVYWANLGIPRRRRAMRKLLGYSAAIALAVFWSVPSALVASLAEPQHVAQLLGLRGLQNDSAALFALSLVSPLALLSLLALLVPVLRALAELEHPDRRSYIQLSILRKYFTFLVLQAFLLQIIAGTVLSSLREILRRPGDIVVILGQQVPQTAAFFMKYICVKACTGTSLELLRVVEAALAGVRTLLLRLCWGISPSALAAGGGPRYSRPVLGLVAMPAPGARPQYAFDHGRVLADQLFVLLLGVAYAAIAPLLLPLAAAYFALTYVTWRHQLLVVYQPPRNSAPELAESGGMLWPTIFRCVVAALVVGDLTLLGIMVLKGGYTQSVALMLLLLGTAWTAWCMEQEHGAAGRHVPFEDVVAAHAAAATDRRPLLREAGSAGGAGAGTRGATVAADGAAAAAELAAAAGCYVAPYLRPGDVQLGAEWRAVLRQYLRMHPPATPLQDGVMARALSLNSSRSSPSQHREQRASSTHYGTAPLSLSNPLSPAAHVSARTKYQTNSGSEFSESNRTRGTHAEIDIDEFISKSDGNMTTLCAVVTSTLAALHSASQGPCDIYAAAGQRCVVAHSLSRALYAGYDGALYQLAKKGTGETTDIKVTAAGGIADTASHAAFCGTGGGACFVQRIYDQSPMENHLGIEHGAPNLTPPRNVVDAGVNFTDARSNATLGGQRVHGAFFPGDSRGSGHPFDGQGYSNRTARGTARGDAPQSMYSVFGGDHFGGGCCFDYGNAENVSSGGQAGPMFDGSMEAIYFQFGKIGADLENGIYSSKTLAPVAFVAGFVGGDSGNRYSVRAGDAQKAGSLQTVYAGARPKGYEVMKKQGGIVLGIGGDNSPWAGGLWFEGAMTAGFASDATEAAILANIAAAGYSKYA